MRREAMSNLELEQQLREPRFRGKDSHPPTFGSKPDSAKSITAIPLP